jgi:hypothetical protein
MHDSKFLLLCRIYVPTLAFTVINGNAGGGAKINLKGLVVLTCVTSLSSDTSYAALLSATAAWVTR